MEEIITTFTTILNKDLVVSKEAIQYAKSLQLDNIRASTLSKSLPEAWKELLLDPTESFIDSIADKVEKSCGYRPADEQVKLFLKDSHHIEKECNYSLQNNVIRPRKRIYSNSVQGKSSDKPSLERDFVIIKGVEIYTEREGNKSKEYFLDVFPRLLALIPEKKLSLQNIHYCKSYNLLAGSQYPVISKIKKIC